MLEVWTLGGGEYLVNVFNAVAAWTGGGGYRAMLQVVFVMGLAYSLFVVAFSLDWRAWLNWFIQATAIYMMLLVPTVTVKVTDRIDPGLAPSVVANVPLGLGVMASFTSQLGDWMTETAETVFVMPAALQMNTKGVIYGARLMEKAQTFEISDPVFAANMDEHFKQCVFYDILLGFKDMRDITSSNNIWAAVGPGSPSRAQKWIERTGYGTTDSYVIRCDQAYNQLNAQWTAEIDQSLLPFARATYPKLAEAAAVARLKTDLPQVAAAMHGTSTDPYAYLQQVSTMSAFMAARESFSDAAWDAYASQRADAQARNTYTSIAQQAMTWVPLLGIVLQVVFYAMFPVIFPLFLFPRTGISTLKGYATGFFYLASWGPLYVILHMFVMNRAASAYAAVAPQGMTLLVGNGIEAVNNDIATVAGFLMMSVPFLAAGMARGAMAIAGHATSMLAPAQSAAEAAAVERTTGNYAYGNESFQNLTSNMRQSNKWDDRAAYASGYASGSFMHPDGVVESSFAGGVNAFDTRGAISNLAYTPTRTAGFSSEMRQVLSQGEGRVEATRNAASEAWTATANTGTELMESATKLASSSTENGSSFTNSVTRMNEVTRSFAENLQKRFGLSESDSQNIARASIMQATGDGSLGAFASRGIPGVVGADARASLAARIMSQHQLETGERITADEALSRLSEHAYREANSTQVRAARDDFVKQASSVSDQTTRGLTERLGMNISDARSASLEASRTEDAYTRLSHDFSESRNRGYTFNENETQKFVRWSQEELLKPEYAMVAASGWHPRIATPENETQQQAQDYMLQRFMDRRVEQAREELGISVPDHLDRTLEAPSITTGAGVRAWGEQGAGGIRNMAPDVNVRASSRNLEVAGEVDRGIGEGSARIMNSGLQLSNEVGDAERRAGVLGDAVDRRSHQSLGRTLPIVSPLIDGAEERFGAAKEWVEDKLEGIGIGGGGMPGPVQSALPRSGAGYRSYSPQREQYGTGGTVSELQESSAAWAARGGSPVNIGDISLRGGGDIRGHDTHEVGQQVDVRPFRNDGRNEPTTWQSQSYDRQQTRDYVRFMKERNPGMTVLFNDPVLIREGLTRPYRGHDNHMHLDFSRRR
ncbi:penicillin-insensitive murein endopeptidase [Qipengyuania citrea]|uniref:penicillin-insensitive murein endopeptidase n=1 Tax=Qipengyuania citrea TaxID=225971 RepID=UPI003298DBB7